jgi:hypothetical protein
MYCKTQTYKKIIANLSKIYISKTYRPSGTRPTHDVHSGFVQSPPQCVTVAAHRHLPSITVKKQETSGSSIQYVSYFIEQAGYIVYRLVTISCVDVDGH